jgi:hypothetical protein
VLEAHDRAYVCRACVVTGARLSGDAVAFLRGLGGRTPAAVAASGAVPRVLRQIERVHQRLLVLHLDKELRSARVIRELRPEL